METYPNFIPVCASWAFGQWGCQSDGSFAQAEREFFEGAQTKSIPLTLIAIEADKPAGMVSLWESDFRGRLDLTPWLKSLYVHPFHRNKGIALLLIKRLEQEAWRLGHRSLYLTTEDAKALYAKAGWQEIESVRTPYGEAALMTKALTQANGAFLE
ncbi:GNAT family N-acetyltransferase [Sinorhizobium americanum]|uniref:GNAT family N-acetyltransferase n=1 Tax=Sinorhizobium americanum TaxID=194963 RepID=UPI001F345478|nr:GNAT family N-acetyltransferase [Sinorhizobium americanum]